MDSSRTLSSRIIKRDSRIYHNLFKGAKDLLEKIEIKKMNLLII
jgi:hypothetical protein